MAEPGTTWLIETALRCYPARWRRRHGGEAAELAALLIRDGAPAGSIAWSYLAGAARAWLMPRAGRRLSVAACALLVAACSLGASAGMLASAAPARAASTSQARGPAQGRPAEGRPAQFRLCSSPPVPAVTSATGHPPMIIPEAGHGRSC
jgi:hypothetical protein